MPETTSNFNFPAHIKTVLITGAGGFIGRQLVQLLLSTCPQLSLITTDVSAPPTYGVEDEQRLISVGADLGDKAQVEKLFGYRPVQGVFALHGIMSGQSESDFTLGYAVNLHSHLNLITTASAHAKSSRASSSEPLPVYINVSSLAVYGGSKATPQSTVVPEDTPLIPETSYGVCKNVIEMVTYDHARKGFLDARSVRLPTVCVRTGAPSSAASSFISSLIREPLQGIPTTCPIASSVEDPMLDDMGIYVTRVKTVVWNIAYALGVKDEDVVSKVGKLRTINLPGIKINTRQILSALEKFGGPKATALVDYKKDPAVIAICDTWAGDYVSDSVRALGFKVDSRETGYEDAVRDFVEDLEEAKKSKA